MRVALYARYSSDQQRDASIEDQVRICRNRADHEGWTVTETFADHAISGATRERPGFQNLSEAIWASRLDVVMAESLDRFSRDLEHIAAFYKLCSFHRVRIYTLADGEVSELHIGLKGTMSALYLKDLGDKTRRGLEGRIRKGRSVGTPPYGYRVVRQLAATGELDRGLRKIEPTEAAIIGKIFTAYAGGASPRRIARDLNERGVPAPGGGVWYDATIRGRARRGDGILRNETYVGRLVWRRRFSVKDPITGRDVRRYAEESTHVVHEVPELRIIDADLWLRVRSRLTAEAAPTRPAPIEAPIAGFEDRRRPRHLLTGKLICGVCGRTFASYGQDYLGCPANRHNGCTNGARFRRPILEKRILTALGTQLMQPDLLNDFIAAFNADIPRLMAEVNAQATARHREATALDRKIANLVEAIADGRSSQAILAKLTELEAQRALLPALLPRVPFKSVPAQAMAEIYRALVAELQTTPAGNSDPEALEAARALIDKVIVTPPETNDDPPGIELIGELYDMLKAAGLDQPNNRSSNAAPDPALQRFISSVKEGPGGKAPGFLSYTRSPCKSAEH